MLTLVAGLPASDAPPVAVSPQPQASRIDRTTPLQVLLVEDNDINALLARRLLEKVGCEVRPPSTAARRSTPCDACSPASIAAYDLVFMDSHMPVLDGLEATRAIKRLYAAHGDDALRSPPIVAVTANAFEEDRRRCLAAGMDDYLAKPFDREGLLRVLETWCGALAASPAAS